MEVELCHFTDSLIDDHKVLRLNKRNQDEVSFETGQRLDVGPQKLRNFQRLWIILVGLGRVRVKPARDLAID